MPMTVREAVQLLITAGFVEVKGGKGSHRKFEKAEPRNTNNWLAASPKECIISANIAMLPVKIKAKSFKKPRMKLTIAADKEDMLPFLSKLKNLLITSSFAY